MPWSVAKSYSGPRSLSTSTVRVVGGQPHPCAPSDAQMRVLGRDELAVARVDRLRHRDQAERRLHVAAGLDPPAGDRHGDVLLALEVLVGGLARHRHADLRLPVDVVGPDPEEAALLPVAGCTDVHDLVDVVELE